MNDSLHPASSDARDFFCFSELYLGFFLSVNGGLPLVSVLSRQKSVNAFALTEINAQISRAKRAST
jgi:hypothetical protein